MSHLIPAPSILAWNAGRCLPSVPAAEKATAPQASPTVWMNTHPTRVCLPGCFQVTFIQPALGHWVFALDTFRCIIWHSLWARVCASPASLKLYKQTFDTEANVAVLELQEIYAVTLSNKNTQGEHFSCFFFSWRGRRPPGKAGTELTTYIGF